MRTKETFQMYLKEIQETARKEGFEELDPIFTEQLRCRYFGEDVVIGESKRLWLREMKSQDLKILLEFERNRSEPVLKDFFRRNPKESEEFLNSYISHMYPIYGYGIYLVLEKATGQAVGLCGFGNIEVEGNTVIDIGYYIQPKFRRRGYAKEAVHIVLEYGKNYLELSEVYGKVSKENQISKNLLIKKGFQLVRVRKEPVENYEIYKKNF